MKNNISVNGLKFSRFDPRCQNNQPFDKNVDIICQQIFSPADNSALFFSDCIRVSERMGEREIEREREEGKEKKRQILLKHIRKKQKDRKIQDRQVETQKREKEKEKSD